MAALPRKSADGASEHHSDILGRKSSTKRISADHVTPLPTDKSRDNPRSRARQSSQSSVATASHDSKVRGNSAGSSTTSEKSNKAKVSTDQSHHESVNVKPVGRSESRDDHVTRRVDGNSSNSNSINNLSNYSNPSITSSMGVKNKSEAADDLISGEDGEKKSSEKPKMNESPLRRSNSVQPIKTTGNAPRTKIGVKRQMSMIAGTAAGRTNYGNQGQKVGRDLYIFLQLHIILFQ